MDGVAGFGAGVGYEAADVERWAPEHPKSPHRGPFERDRARVLHSSALRRLSAKTQVVGPGGDDFSRNRLTHSLEVAQVGRDLAGLLGCDQDIVDAACLAHDLGHPPFGHNGERALAEISRDAGGFEGNAQTLRLLTRLEPKVLWPDGASAGLNLTRATLDAATKYPWTLGENPSAGTKFGYYPDDAAVFGWLRAGAPEGRRCVEAQVMDLADDIAYSVHDVEDAIVGSWLDPGQLGDELQRREIAERVRDWYLPEASDDEVEAALDRLVAQPWWIDRFDHSRPGLAALKNTTSQLIGRFIEQVVSATRARAGEAGLAPSVPLVRYAADVVVPPETSMEITVLKAVASVFVMTAAGRDAEYTWQRGLLQGLVEALESGQERGAAMLDVTFSHDWAAAPDAAARRRVVIDQVASLTDTSALSWARELGV